VYKNGQDDTGLWVMNVPHSGDNLKTYGGVQSNIAPADYDVTAEYTVTYIVLDKHLFTNSPADVKAFYAKNIRSAHDDPAGQVSDSVTVVSVIVQSVAELYKCVKALGG
jgi:hypothetical protein